jgi:hypothetical protein
MTGQLDGNGVGGDACQVDDRATPCRAGFPHDRDAFAPRGPAGVAKSVCGDRSVDDPAAKLDERGDVLFGVDSELLRVWSLVTGRERSERVASFDPAPAGPSCRALTVWPHLTGQIQFGMVVDMSDRQSTEPENGAKQRILAALAKRDEEIDLAQRRFWNRVSSEIAAGQISQARAARVLDVTRETLRLRTREYIPDAPIRPGAMSLYLAVGMRLHGETSWRAQAEPCHGHSVVSMVMGGGRRVSPYDGQRIEFAYREIAEPPSHDLGYPPMFSAPGLSPRPLYFSEAVCDELFAPAYGRYGSGAERSAWKKRIAQLPRPAGDASTRD